MPSVHLARLVLAVILLVPVAAVADHPQPQVIAFAQDTLGNDFRRAQVFAVRDAAARHPNLRFVHADAKGQTSLLIHQIQGFIDQGVDILVVGTNDEKAVVPVIAKAHRQGIPVIILDRGVASDQYASFINSDNILIGRLGGEYIAAQLDGRGSVLLLEGIQTADVTQLRSQGFLEVMAQYPEIRVIRRTGNYLRRDALIEMEKLVAEGIEVDAIFSESDSMLSGVRMVQMKNGIDPGSILSIGCDYTSEARAAILAGQQTGSILFPLGGEETVEIALRLLAGEEVPHHLEIPVRLITRDDAKQTPAIF